MNAPDVKKIIHKVINGGKPTVSQTAHLLSLRGGRERDMLFSAARYERSRYFGNKLFLYGFIYFSTHCRNNCSFCQYRISSGGARYRKSTQEIADIAAVLKESGVHLIDLTMGEDTYYYENPERLPELVSLVKNAAGLPVMVSPGVIPPYLTDNLVKAGADWYALYQETFSRTVFKRMRVEQSFDERLAAKRYAHGRGMLIEEGLLAASPMGTSLTALARSVLKTGQTGASQVRVMTYIPPGEKTRLNIDTELNAIAVMRLLYPDLLIPASLDLGGADTLSARLCAGANVVTSIIPPGMGLAGVADKSRGIEDGGRTVSQISQTINDLGLCIADADEYKTWVRDRKNECADNGRAVAGSGDCVFGKKGRVRNNTRR